MIANVTPKALESNSRGKDEETVEFLYNEYKEAYEKIRHNPRRILSSAGPYQEFLSQAHVWKHTKEGIEIMDVLKPFKKTLICVFMNCDASQSLVSTVKNSKVGLQKMEEMLSSKVNISSHMRGDFSDIKTMVKRSTSDIISAVTHVLKGIDQDSDFFSTTEQVTTAYVYMMHYFIRNKQMCELFNVDVDVESICLKFKEETDPALYQQRLKRCKESVFRRLNQPLDLIFYINDVNEIVVPLGSSLIMASLLYWEEEKFPMRNKAIVSTFQNMKKYANKIKVTEIRKNRAVSKRKRVEE
jgi:hypothetical protein